MRIRDWGLRNWICPWPVATDYGQLAARLALVTFLLSRLANGTPSAREASKISEPSLLHLFLHPFSPRWALILT